MVAEAQIQGDSMLDLMTLPAEAIVRDPQGATIVFVYYPDQGRVYARRVGTGAVYGREIAIKSGLSGNESVVLAGQEKLRDGVMVPLTTENASSRDSRYAGRKRGAPMNPVKASLRYPTVTLILAAMAVVGRNSCFPVHAAHGRSDASPFAPGLVIALYPGATSEQVEKQVTKTLEKHIFKFPEVRKEKTYSTSRPGLVIINVELEDNVKNSGRRLGQNAP